MNPWSTRDVPNRSALVRAFAATYATSIEEVNRAVETATEIVSDLPGSEHHFDVLVASSAQHILFKRFLQGV